jgi:hypothetical protein
MGGLILHQQNLFKENSLLIHVRTFWINRVTIQNTLSLATGYVDTASASL